MKEKLWPLLVFSLLVGCDRLSKGIFNNADVYKNELGSFNVPLEPLFLKFFILFILLAVLSAYRHYQDNPLFVWGAVFIAAGGISNAWDRWHLGYVPDIFTWHQLTFNLADISVSVGVILCSIALFFCRKTKKE